MKNRFMNDFPERWAFPIMTHEAPSAQNTALAAGCQAVNIIYSPIGQAIIDGWAKIGVQMIVSRIIGTEHIDVAHAKARGIQVCHIWDSPDAVADYALMLSC